MISIEVHSGKEGRQLFTLGEVRLWLPAGVWTETRVQALNYRAERLGDWSAKRLVKRLQRDRLPVMAYAGVDLHPLLYSLCSQLLRRRYAPALTALGDLRRSGVSGPVTLRVPASDAKFAEWLAGHPRFGGLDITIRISRRRTAREQLSVVSRAVRTLWACVAAPARQRRLPRPGRDVVLFLPHSEVAEGRCASLVRALAARGAMPVLVTDAHPPVDLTTPRVRFGELPVAPRQVAAVLRHIRALRTAGIESAIAPLALRPLVATVMRRALPLLYDCLVRAEGIRRVATASRARAIVFTSHHAYGHTAAVAAERAGIPSVWVQQAVMERRPYYGISWKRATKYLCWGEVDVLTLARAEADPRDVEVVGSFYVDELVRRMRNIDRAAARRGLGVAADTFLVTFISWWLWFTFTADDKRRWLTMIARAVEGLGETVHLLVKLHPVESDLTLDEAVVSAVLPRDRYTIMGPTSVLEEIMVASDLFVMPASTVAVVAGAMNMPIAYINTDNDAMEYARRGLVREVESVSALQAFVQGLRNGDVKVESANAVVDYIHSLDGDAGIRVADAVRRVMKPVVCAT
ncbi:MAG: hypothetical protein HY702_05770 [Gemmatimonadetes bacterium]|nr:hypothetical protein [Gemmatimonadota bacterium]